jgi:hypothetical protein
MDVEIPPVRTELLWRSRLACHMLVEVPSPCTPGSGNFLRDPGFSRVYRFTTKHRLRRLDDLKPAAHSTWARRQPACHASESRLGLISPV